MSHPLTEIRAVPSGLRVHVPSKETANVVARRSEEPSNIRGLGDALDAARKGQEWAWREIYLDLAPSLLGYVRVRGAVDPEAVVGEVFLQVVRDITRFDGSPDSFRSWVFVIAHHRLLDDIRRRSRRPEEVPDEVGGEQRSATDVEDSVVQSESIDEIRAMISGLSPQQSEVLMLRIVGGLTIEETACVLGKRRGAVKALQRRGIEAIRMRVVGEEGER